MWDSARFTEFYLHPSVYLLSGIIYALPHAGSANRWADRGSMSDTISIKKLKRIMYACLRWRLQIPNYYPHNPIPKKDTMSHSSKMLVTAYQDLLREIEKIEKSDNQRNLYKEIPFPDDVIDEYSWERNP